MRPENAPQMVIMGSPVECWLCKRVAPSACSININMGAAASSPSLMQPICQECAANQFAPPSARYVLGDPTKGFHGSAINPLQILIDEATK